MRTLTITAAAALGLSTLMAASPAAAQVATPGPVYYGGEAGGQFGGSIPAPQVMYNGRPAQLPEYRPDYRGTPQVGEPVYYEEPRDTGFYAGPGQNAPRGNRWGGQINGRWEGGMRAPGGWGAYHRPSRGWQLPGYWMGSGFRIPDYYSYGLSEPRPGHFWVRYYDDAVLVDGHGRVSDWADGVSWGGGAVAGAWSNSESYSNVTVGGAGIRQVDPNAYYGAQGYPGGYASPVAVAPPAVQSYPACASACGGYGQGYGYQGGASYGASSGYAGGYSGGYYYGAPSVTTIVIQSAPVITTTTTTVTEEYAAAQEEVVTSYSAAPVKRLVRKGPAKKHYRRSAPRCAC